MGWSGWEQFRNLTPNRSRSNPVAFSAGVVDFFTASLTVFPQGFDLILLAQITRANTRLERSEQIPVLHVERLFLPDFTRMLPEQLVHLFLGEVFVNQRSVQIQRDRKSTRLNSSHLG